ncbi:MAG TPA: Gfo/Idh/MocA family oxidoreductase [Firmicutes bacterium]|nr:Gfo/Idh/MocA family oxidoreductase [Bacillota bacterium]
MAKAAKTVKVGIVGTKFAADLHIKAYERCPGVEVVAAAGRDKGRLTEFADAHGIPGRYTDYREMLEDPDIDLVSICVPNFLHHEVGLAIAAAGKHAICEKPLATTLEDAREMVRAFEAAGRTLFYAEDWIFAPAIRRAREIIEEGAIGQVLFVKAKENHNGSHSPYAQTLEYCGGGSLIHLAIHPAGFIRWLTRQEVVEVIAKRSGGGERNLVHKKLEGEDWGAALLTMEDGTYGFIEGNYITLGGMDDAIEIYGTKGSIKINVTLGSPITVYSTVGYSYVVEKADMSVGWTHPAIDEESSLGYESEIATFVKCVAEGAPAPWGCRAVDGLAALAIIKAAYISAEQGKPVNPTALWKDS